MYTTAKDPAHYIDSLVPSYLRSVDTLVSAWFMPTYSTRFDYQGRVIRLDTFSKVGQKILSA